ncbi:hypothetical protein ACJX0J_021286, partial [Zea mays]
MKIQHKEEGNYQRAGGLQVGEKVYYISTNLQVYAYMYMTMPMETIRYPLTLVAAKHIKCNGIDTTKVLTVVLHSGRTWGNMLLILLSVFVGIEIGRAYMYDLPYGS